MILLRLFLFRGAKVKIDALDYIRKVIRIAAMPCSRLRTDIVFLRIRWESLIIYRYLSKELLLATLSVTAVLLSIIAGGRFLGVMGDAAQGRILAEVVLTILLYKLPNFIMLILPLGYFLGLVISFGRLYVDHEMAVLHACGVGPVQLLRWMSLPMWVTFSIVAILSTWLCPLVLKKTQILLEAQYNRSEFETLSPSRFHATKDMRRVTYARKLSDDKRQMQELFIVEENADLLAVIVAESGVRRVDTRSGIQYLELTNGHRYEGLPGINDYRVIHFSHYRMQMETTHEVVLNESFQSLDIKTLWEERHKNAAFTAEWHWRVALPVIILVLTFIAIPLSKVSPRQGRFLKLFPAIFIYLFYLTLLINGKSMIEKEKWPFYSLWWIHSVFILAGTLLYLKPYYRLLINKLKNPRGRMA